LLQNEQTALYGSEDFKGKSAYEILQRFKSNSIFEETCNLVI
jgi:hypothetical protein